MSFEFEFVDEVPAQVAVGNKWAAVGEVLREHPGQWAKVSSSTTDAGASSQAYKINKGTNRALGKGFEATRRKHMVYVRYVGDV